MGTNWLAYPRSRSRAIISTSSSIRSEAVDPVGSAVAFDSTNDYAFDSSAVETLNSVEDKGAAGEELTKLLKEGQNQWLKHPYLACLIKLFIRGYQFWGYQSPALFLFLR